MKLKICELVLIAVLGLGVTSGCEAQVTERPATKPAQITPETPAVTVAQTHKEGAGECAAIEELNKLDPRRPVPLQPMMAWHQKQNMQAHLVAIQGIIEGLTREDWEGIATASAAIESSPQMQQMCQHMGAGAEGFTAMALDFHKRADAIGVAAKAKDSQAVLAATSNTLQACTGCHAVYRQDVMDAKLWSERTGSTHEPGAMHHGGGHH